MTQRNRFVPALLALVILLTACGPKTTATPTTNPDLVLTSVAQTAIARLSAVPPATQTPTLTPIPSETPTLMPSPTQVITTITGTLPVVQPTQPGAAPTGLAAGVDRLIMVSDLDITDGTLIDAGAKFTKKWRLMNAGTSTWTTGYSLVHTSGDEIKGPASVPLTAEVGPGKIIDVAVVLTAPSKKGKYTSYWMLKNANGQTFGIGPNAKDGFWVQIQVGGNANPEPTDTPQGTPGVATSTPEVGITNLRLQVDDGDVTGSCPHTFTFTAKFRLSTATTVTYQWEVSDPDKYVVPPAQQAPMGAGPQSVPLAFDVTSTGSGWLRFHITSPDNLTSGTMNFSMTCTP
jgi:hypothetical protein